MVVALGLVRQAAVCNPGEETAEGSLVAEALYTLDYRL